MDNIELKDSDITTIRLSLWEDLREQLKSASQNAKEKNALLEKHLKRTELISYFYRKLIVWHITSRSSSITDPVDSILKQIEGAGLHYEIDSEGVKIW